MAIHSGRIRTVILALVKCYNINIILLVVTNHALANHTANVAPNNGHKLCNYDSLITNSSLDPDTELCSYNQQWFCFSSTAKTYNCVSGDHSHISCSGSGPLLELGCCTTCSEDTGLVTVTKCPQYFRVLGHNVSTDGHTIQLPKTLAELNDSMCGPMNRKGIACSECIDGFGPSVTSFGYICINCTDAWYRVPLFLVLLFVPITVFYLIILIF